MIDRRFPVVFIQTVCELAHIYMYIYTYIYNIHTYVYIDTYGHVSIETCMDVTHMGARVRNTSLGPHKKIWQVYVTARYMTAGYTTTGHITAGYMTAG